MSQSFYARQYSIYISILFLFFFNDTATTEIYTLSLHDALRSPADAGADRRRHHDGFCHGLHADGPRHVLRLHRLLRRSEEHTSELQSRQYLVCRLLLEKNKPPVSPTQTCQHFSAS